MSEPRNQLSATEQPDPIFNDRPAVWELIIADVDHNRFEERPENANLFGTPDNLNISGQKVKAIREGLLKDMRDRDAWGREKYKVPLQPFNGRDALVDLYQEFLDATAYTMQYRLENPQDPTFEEIYKSLLSQLNFIKGQLFGRDGR
jgi:hypothetical protein